MKIPVKASLWALSLITLLAAPTLLAQAGASANGSFQFSTPDGVQTVEFNARSGSNGSQMTFSGPVQFADQDVDGTGDTGTTGSANLSMTVKFDCFRASGNRAAMSGVVTSSSVAAYVGRRAVLAVEDNGEGSKAAPDRFTWGLYGASAMSWTPSDAELVFDNGWMFSWIATDAERFDDAGVNARPSADVDCQTFPLSSYAFEDLPHGAGNIQVKQ